jgi:hypothetical protein
MTYEQLIFVRAVLALVADDSDTSETLREVSERAITILNDELATADFTELLERSLEAARRKEWPIRTTIIDPKLKRSWETNSQTLIPSAKPRTRIPSRILSPWQKSRRVLRSWLARLSR